MVTVSTEAMVSLAEVSMVTPMRLLNVTGTKLVPPEVPEMLLLLDVGPAMVTLLPLAGVVKVSDARLVTLRDDTLLKVIVLWLPPVPTWTAPDPVAPAFGR